MANREKLSEQTIVKCREILAPRNALLYKGTDLKYTSLATDAEITRVWKEGVADLIPQLCDFLDTWTDASNTVALNYVVDPQANGETFHGKWRQAFVRPFFLQDNTLALMQVLRRGYIEKLVEGTAFDWSEARVERAIRSPSHAAYGSDSPMIYLVLRLPNISPDKIHAIELEVEGLSSSTWAPEVRGEKYATGMYLLNKIVNIEDDGSATLTLFLGKTRLTLYGFSNWLTSRREDVVYHFNVPEELAQSVLTAAQGKGKSGTVSHSFDTKLCDIIIRERNFNGEIYTGIRTSNSCGHYQLTDFYWGVTSPDAYSAPTTYSSGVSYEKSVGNNGDGTWDIAISMTVRRYREYMTRLASISTLVTMHERQQLGVSTEAIPDISTIPAGTSYQQDIRPNEDCSKDVVTAYRKGVYNDEGLEQVSDATLGSQHAHVIHNSGTKETVTAAVQGSIYTVRNTLTDLGQYDISSGIAKSKPDTITFTSERTSFNTTSSIQYKNSPTVITAPVTTGSGVYRISQNENEDGTYDGNLSYTVGSANGVAGFESLNSQLTEEDSVIYNGVNAQVAAPASGQGTIYRASNSLLDDGTYNAQLTYEKKNPAQVYDATMHTVLQDVHTTEYHNQTVSISAPEDVQGTIYRVNQSMDESGVYNGRMEQIKSRSITFSSVIGQGFGVNASALIYRNFPTLITAPGLGLSPSLYSYRVDGLTLNEDGTYDGALVYSDRRAGGGGFDVIRFDFYVNEPDGRMYHEMYQATNQDDIDDFMDDTSLAAARQNQSGSGVAFHGRGRWMATRVRRVP